MEATSDKAILIARGRIKEARKSQAHIARAAERRMPKMHWRWRKRGRDIVELLTSRFGSDLPDDHAGVDAVKMLAQHYMRLHIDPERVAKANLRLWASWLTEKAIAGIIKGARKAKTPSAAKLGKDWRVTVDEVAALGLWTVAVFSVTLEQDRTRQARRRRKAGTGTKRGRPKSEGLKPWQIAGASSKASYYRSLKNKAKTSETEISHAAFPLCKMLRDEFQSHAFQSPDHPSRAPQAPRRQAPTCVPIWIRKES